MKTPLHKRYPRLLKRDFSRYFVIFVLICISISIGCGMLVAGGSLMSAYNESFNQYNVEDGYFETTNRQKSMSDAVKKQCNVYENFYHDQTVKKKTIRFFVNRTHIDKVCFMSGRLPKGDNEIALDRMFASNNSIKVGSTLWNTYKVVGLVALSDYSSLFQKNSDSMFNAINFGVGIMSQSSFNTHFASSKIVYRYSYRFKKTIKDDTMRAKYCDQLLKQLNKDDVDLSAYVPRYQNQAISFTGNDFGSDTVDTQIFIYVLIAIIALISAITIRETIEHESSTIGILRALGYSRKEMMKHYLTLPMLVTFIAALFGNVLGYTVIKDYCVSLYYGSNSLPTYHTKWNMYAFMTTTIIPLILMYMIHMLVLKRELKRSPLSLIRKEEKKKRKKHVHLSHQMPFLQRFSLRLILQNKGGLNNSFSWYSLYEFLRHAWVNDATYS